ncbi:ubiquitin-protein ligase E3C [Neodiprion lecontei]|uniref:Ubiquitin-protein ligase E3C n=1 Tax=Neodiprion lecontei TaxID=441921 RepID=A0A6J0C4G9_NEOLC|nr:ubiquitin-protein ligase E3C [Neodiprion lecontei]
MYSFDGDYRRKPQQNLAGASRRDEKAVLLQHAQLERLKREQQRQRHDAAVKIQAQIRQFVTRQLKREHERHNFDVAQKALGNNPPSLEEISPLLRQLLFFYDEALDGSRLLWILRHVLKDHKRIKELTTISTEWSWRLRWILKLSMRKIVDTVSQDPARSIAVPLRVLEVFTVKENTEGILKTETDRHLIGIFVYLAENKYFVQLRRLIDEKVPPLLEATPVPPTPMAACLLDMIKRPLGLIHTMEENNKFSITILEEFCYSILAPRMSEPIKMLVLPALTEFQNLPYKQLIDCINRLANEPTLCLLYSILSLEPVRFACRRSRNTLTNYLQVLASLSSTIASPPVEQSLNFTDESDSDTDTDMVDQDEADIRQKCIEMLNAENRVQGILVVVDQSEDPLMLQALCQLCHNLLITNKMAVPKYKLLYMLAFKPSFLRHLWTALMSVRQTSLFGGVTLLLQVVSRGIALDADNTKKIVPLLAVFCSLFSLLIATLHDTEFFNDGSQVGTSGASQQTMPFTTVELVPLSAHLKGVCLGLVELAFPDTRPTVRDDYKTAVLGASATQTHQNTQMWVHLFKVTVGLLRQLHTRDLRKQFCPEGHWIASNIVIPLDKPQDFTFRRRRLRGYVPFQGLRAFTREDLEEGPPWSTKEVRTLTLLREIPFVVPFNDRVVVFQSLLNHDKEEQQGEWTNFMRGPYIQIAVRRNYLYEDAFDKLSPENESELRLKMKVQLVNAAGLEEAGVDGGGLFREFLSELLKTSFDPNRGFFRLTKDNMLYPNPTVHLLVDDFPKHYYFIGRILGKALYENLLVELPFAEFFLSKIVGRQADVDVHHLASLDPIMYRNLLYLKSYQGDVTELGLDFTVLSDELGERRIDELKPGGANVTVTSHNRIEYIHLMADYKLNKQIRAQCYAFKQGISNVVSLDWLQMFNNKELQVLISGAQIPVDVRDLKLHTNYTGGYTPDHPTIISFWKIADEFTDQQRSQLLKFVTSCSRPPLLGFKELDPPFCIQHAGSVDRLPTSSTCMNLLKLPEFPDERTLREKLLYAIQAGAGFELS